MNVFSTFTKQLPFGMGDEADSEPLVGMSLMEGYQLMMQVFEGGQVELRKVGTV